MPFTATSISQAIAFTNTRTGIGSPLGFLLFYISTFNSLWSPNFDPDDTDDRTVRNWLIQSRAVQDVTPTIGNSQQSQDVINVACRVLYATNAAFSAGRITTAQRDAVRTAWNGSFGAFP